MAHRWTFNGNLNPNFDATPIRPFIRAWLWWEMLLPITLDSFLPRGSFLLHLFKSQFRIDQQIYYLRASVPDTFTLTDTTVSTSSIRLKQPAFLAGICGPPRDDGAHRDPAEAILLWMPIAFERAELALQIRDSKAAPCSSLCLRRFPSTCPALKT
jgi:hypothetical protein